MELLQLRYFHEVAQTQHMTNSAKRLGVAQPALTQAIRRLEGELDAKLFERRAQHQVDLLRRKRLRPRWRRCRIR